MAAHAHLKNEFTEDEKCHNLMSWLKLTFLRQKVDIALVIVIKVLPIRSSALSIIVLCKYHIK